MDDSERYGAEGESKDEAVARLAKLSPIEFGQVKENEAGITIDTWLRNEGSKPVSGPISDQWTRFNSSGRFGSIEWADSVDPSDKAGYAYAWLPDENGKVTPRNSTLNPGDEIKIRRFVAVGKSPAHALGVVAAKLGKTGQLKLNVTGTDKKQSKIIVNTNQV